MGSFWEAQREKRGTAADPPAAAPAPPQQEQTSAVPEPPMKPAPMITSPDGESEEIEVCKGQETVSKEMQAIIEKPFSQQKKALRALRRDWHPDKNADREAVATRVFQ